MNHTRDEKMNENDDKNNDKIENDNKIEKYIDIIEKLLIQA